MRKYDYWKKRNVPHPKPEALFGNYKDYILLKKHRIIVTHEICQKYCNEPYIGTYYSTEPALLVVDPEILKLILVKDFHFFHGREVTSYKKEEAITRNLFFNRGDEWKVLRHNLTPLFTTSKMKNMFPLIISCADNLKDMIEMERVNFEYFDTRSLMSRYAMDCVITCAFGFNSNTMITNNPANPFVLMGKKIFEISITNAIKTIFRPIWPKLFYRLKLSMFEANVIIFFNNLLTGVFQSRLSSESFRNDFVDLILNWKKEKYISGESLPNTRTGERNTVNIEVTDELLVSQCVLMFGAGFETTANTMTFLLYEIAKHEAVQTKLLEEVDAYFEKHNGVIEYGCLTEMPFLTSCLEETLRLYPALGVLTREVMDDYTLPTGLTLRKADRVHIPVYHIHRNPANFSNPDDFQPNRFMREERKNIKPFTYLPFGEGPRSCMGK